MKGKRRLKARLLSFLLTFAMVIGMLPANALTVQAETTPNCEWNIVDGTYNLEVKDGQITLGDLYKELDEQSTYFGSPDSSWTSISGASGYYGGGYRVGGSIYAGSSYTGDLDIDKEVSLNNGDSYAVEIYVKTGTGMLNIPTYGYVSTSKSFVARHYYLISLTYNDADITSGATYNTGKIYVGDTVTITVPDNGNKIAVLMDADNDTARDTDGDNQISISVNSKNDAILTLSYEEPAPTANITAADVTGGTVSATRGFGSIVLNDATYGAEYPITVTPGEGYYLNTVTITDVYVSEGITKESSTTYTTDELEYDKNTRGFSKTLSLEDDHSYTVTPDFIKKTIGTNATVSGGDYYEVKFNPAKGVAAQMNGTGTVDGEKCIEQMIFEAVVNTAEEATLPSGLEWDDLTYYYRPALKIGSYNTDWIGLNEDGTNQYYFGERYTSGGIEEVKLTWPASADAFYPETSIEVKVKLVEGRKQASINYTKPAQVEFESEDEIVNAIIAASSTNSSNAIVATRVSETLPTSGNTATLQYKLSVAEDTDYLANEITVEIDVKAKQDPATINITVVGNGTVSVGTLIATGTLAAGTYNIVATPSSSTGYVASVTVDNIEVGNDISKYANCVFTDSVTVENEKTYNITVVFEERSIGVNNPLGTVKMNKYYDPSEQYGDIETNIINAVVAAAPVGAEKAAGQVQIYSSGINVGSYSIAAGWYGLEDKVFGVVNVADAVFNDAQEPVRVVYAGDARYPEVYTEQYVTVEDSREETVITVGSLGTIEFDYTTEIDNAVKAAVSTNNGTVVVTAPETHAATDKDGEEQTLIYTATVEGTESITGATKEITVTVKGKVHKPTVSVVNDSEKGSVNADLAGVHNAGSVNVVVTPKANTAYYVESVTVSDGTTSETISGTYSNTVFSGTFDVVNGDAGAEKTYTVTITYGERTISTNDNKEVSYNLSNKYEGEAKENFLAAVLAAAVNKVDGASYEAELVNEAPVAGENKVIITMNSDDKYPEVTKEVTVIVTENRLQATLSVTNTVGTVTIGETYILEDLKAAIIAAGLNASDESKVKYEIVGTPVVPVQGGTTETGYVEVKLSLEETSEYLANSITVKVPVVGAVKKAQVTVNYNVGGTVTDGTNAYTNGEMFEMNSGKLNVVVTPDDAYYIESIKVNNTTIDPSTRDYTLEQQVVDGTGSAATVDAPVYTITVNFVKYSVALDPIPEVEINDYKASADHAVNFSEYGEELQAAILNKLGITTEGAYVEGYIETFNVGWTQLTRGGFAALNPGTETVRIYVPAYGKYPAITEEVEIKFVEERGYASVSHPIALGYMAETEDDIDIVPSLKVSENHGTVTATLVAGQTFPGEGETVELEYMVKVEENEYYLETTAKITVGVTNPQYLTEVIIAEVEGAVITVEGLTDGYAVTGEYVITVTPTIAEGYYIDDVTVSGVGELLGNGAYGDNNVYTETVKITNSNTEDTEITINATVGQRVIVNNDTITGVYFDTNSTYEAQKARILQDVFNAVVNIAETAGITYDDVEVIALETIAGVGEYNFQITWKASDDNHYPAVSTTAKVTLVDNLEPIVINPSVEEITDVNNYTEEDVKKAVTTNLADGVEYELIVGEMPALIQGKPVYVDVTIKVEAGTTYQANDKTVQVPVTGAVNNAEVTVNTPVNGEITLEKVVEATTSDYEAGEYIVTLIPSEGYFIDSLVVELDGEEVTYTYDKFENGQFTITIIDGTGEAVDYVPKYELTATFIKPNITIQDKTVTYYGQEAAELPSMIWSEVFVSTTPEGLTTNANIDADPTVLEQSINDLTVYYLARKAETFTETVTVNLPIVGNQTFTVDIPTGDQWLEISQVVPTGSGMPNQEEIQAIVDKLLEKYSMSELMNMGTEGLKNLAKTELADVYEEYYRFYNAHSFGKSDDGYETVKVVYNSERFGAVESNTALITLDDDRTVTEIKLNEGVEMTYGFTQAELTAKLFDGVYANGEKIEGATIAYITDVEGLNASETAYTVKVEYAGDYDHKHSTAETTIIVNKATATVTVDSHMVQHGTDYGIPVSTTPAGVDNIQFIVGLNVSDVNFEGTSVKGINGEVQLMIPESLQGILSAVGISEGVSMTLSELQEKLLDAAEALGFINSESEVVNVLLNMLESLPTDAADVTVRIGGELPTDIGVYLIGAVTADGNYETAYGVGALVITPNGTKAELDWIVDDENGIITRTLLTSGVYDMGAEVTSVADNNFEAAQSQVVELFLGVDIDGNITIETDQTKLNVGAYTEVALIADWGNTMYYAEPIVRAFVVIADSLNLEFVDATGENNNERLFEFDNTEKYMDVRVTTKEGELLLDTSLGQTSDNLKIYYVGLENSLDPHLSTAKPVHAGTYSVIAIYTLRDDEGMVTHMGVNVGVIVITPTTSDIDVKDTFVEYYDGIEVKTSDMVTATSKVEGLTPDTTVISAGITTNGEFGESGLDAIVGKVNVDMPAWLDNVIKTLGIMENGYNGTGLTKTDFAGYVETINNALTELNINVDVLTELYDVINQLPEDVLITFNDNQTYNAVGAYLVIGVVTDADHYPSVDAGLLVIYPDMTEVELKFEEDWNDNNIFTWKLLQEMNLDASAYYLGTDTVHEEATALVTNIYLGIDDDGDIILTKDKSTLDNGVYTQFALLLDDIASEMYYAEPISRVFIIVPNVAEIVYSDENGVSGNEFEFVFDNKAHALTTNVSVNGVAVENPGSKLSVNYVGVMSNGKAYNSATAPSHVGTYVVTATYKDYDEQGRVRDFGIEVASLVIKPADAEITVTVPEYVFEGNDYEIKIQTETDVENDTPKTLTVLAGVDMDGFTLNGTVNVDFPAAVDNVLKELYPGWYTDGISAETFFAKYDEVVAAIAEEGFDTTVLTQLKDMLIQMNVAKLTFEETDDVKPTAIGIYAIVSMVFDPNYKSDIDTALLAIVPNVTVGTLAFDVEIPGLMNIMPYELVQKFEFGAHVDKFESTDPDMTAENIQVKDVIFGLTTDLELFVGSSENKPNELGIYDQVAYAESGDELTVIVPITRMFTVVESTANVEFYDENDYTTNWLRTFVYDGTAKEVPARLKLLNGEVLPQEPGVWYVGIENDIVVYSSATAPTDVGAYQVIGYYISEEENIYSVGLGAMTITQREATVTLDDKTMTVGDALPEFTYTVENEAAADPLVVTPSTTTDGKTVGTFDITATVEENPNYKVTVVDGTLTVESTGKITSNTWTMSLDSVVYMNYYVNLEGFADSVDFAKDGGVVVWTADSRPTSRDQVQIGLDNCEVIEGMRYNEEYGWGVQSPEIYAKNLGDLVYLRVYVEVAPGQYVYGPVGYYSPELYCRDQLADDSVRDDTQAVCAALLDYGAAAQEYFDYDLENLVDEGLDFSEYDLTYSDSLLDALKVPTAEKANTLTGIRANTSFASATLSLEGAIVLRIGYNLNVDADEIASAELLSWTEDAYNNAETLAYEAGTYSFKSDLVYGAISDKECYVASSDYILAKNLSQTVYYSVRVTMKDGTVYRSGLGYYSPEAYISDMLNTEDAELLSVIQKIAVYSEKARLRFY